MNATMLVRAEQPQWSAEALPLFVFPRRLAARAEDRTSALRACADRHLPRAGSILFRGFPLEDAHDMQRFAEVFGLSLAQTSAAALLTLARPRRAWLGLSGARASRRTIAIADTRELHLNLPRTLRQRLIHRGLRYRHVFSEQGTRWQDVFQTDSRGAVEVFVHAHGYLPSWLDGGALRLERAGAVVDTSQTGAMFFEDTTPMLLHAQAVAQSYGRTPEVELRHRDGTAVERGLLQELVDVFADCSTEIDLEAGDVLLLDTALTCTILPEVEPALHVGAFALDPADQRSS